MTSTSRLLCIIGSGETSPTMSSVHADLLRRLGPDPVEAVLLDTPFAFQENAEHIVFKVKAYFRGSVGHAIEVARAGTLTEDPVAQERELARLREARYVFSGPGSPSYALRHWRDTPVPALLAELLRRGGCLTFASAAAATLGRFALPVYEIYKAGEDLHWLDGLDLLADSTGLDAVVVPHYDNAEGGNHDTSRCYMGERRLRLLEAMLPEDVRVLGVDEHTVCILDLDADTMEVRGRGGVTLRHRGAQRRIEAGVTVPLAEVRAVVGEEAAATAKDVEPRAASAAPPGSTGANPLTETVAMQHQRFSAALRGGNVDAALTALLTLDGDLAAWAHDTLDSDDMDRARSTFRGMLVQLGELAHAGARDPRELLLPFVELALELRDDARRSGRYAEADGIREALGRAGVEVRDAPQGSEWVLHGESAAAKRVPCRPEL